MIPIIVRADDAGSCPEANRAIAQCIEAGVVQCVSVMAIGGFLGDAVQHLAHRTTVEFGLHFALNAEWEAFAWRPVSAPDAVPSLVNEDGYLRPLPSDVEAHGMCVEEAITEARAQLAAVRGAGFHVTYLDEHCGISSVSEELEDALAAFATSEGLLYEKHCATLPVSYAHTGYKPAVPPQQQDVTGLPSLWVTHPGVAEPEREDDAFSPARRCR